MRSRRPAHRALTCRAVRRLVQTYLDREIADERVAPIADHLNRCPKCLRDANGYRRLKERLARLAPPLSPGDLDRLRAFADDVV